MNWTTKITREAPGRLSKQDWVFILYSDHNGATLKLIGYIKSARPTRRHDYRQTQCWNSLADMWKNKPRPSPPDDVIAEARQRLNDELKLT